MVSIAHDMEYISEDGKNTSGADQCVCKKEERLVESSDVLAKLSRFPFSVLGVNIRLSLRR